MTNSTKESQTMPEEWEKRYWTLVNQLRQEVPDTNEEGPIFQFGQKINVDDTIYTIPDWGNVLKFIRQERALAKSQERELLPKFLDEAIKNGSFYHNGINYRIEALQKEGEL